MITTRGLCFAMNARNMTSVFKENIYINNFDKVFGHNAPDVFLNPKDDQEIKLDIDLNLQELTDRSGTSGHVL